MAIHRALPGSRGPGRPPVPGTYHGTRTPREKRPARLLRSSAPSLADDSKPHDRVLRTARSCADLRVALYAVPFSLECFHLQSAPRLATSPPRLCDGCDKSRSVVSECGHRFGHLSGGCLATRGRVDAVNTLQPVRFASMFALCGCFPRTASVLNPRLPDLGTTMGAR